MKEERIAWKPKSSDSNVASVRYRCLLPLEYLKSKGFNIELFDGGNTDQYTVVIFSKLYSANDQNIARQLQHKGSKVILDLCDNHFYNPFNLAAYDDAKANILRMLKYVDDVVCSTDALADVLMQEAKLKKRPIVIGDPVESLPSSKSSIEKLGGSFKRLLKFGDLNKPLPILLWYGSHGSPNAECGISDILNLKKTLIDINQKHKFELVVASNNKKKYKEIIEPLPFHTRYVEWDYKEFKDLLLSAKGVIIPITKNPFTICKTNNRLAMALSYEVPVVADSIPSYEEFRGFCYLDDWENGLESVLKKTQISRRVTKQGYEYIKMHWEPKHLVNKWEELLIHHQ